MKKVFSLFILCISILSFAQSKAPFTGKRDFNILEGYSGTGTPAYYVDVKKSGDVYFGFVQVNQASGEETKEEINAGKYSPKVMKVHFKTYNETFFVKFDKEKIYMTDEKGNISKSEDCCSVSETENGSCICDSPFYQ
ncbi:hypothetical protein [Chryseobacterium limigenitum]|uniref:Uncharacterized protein n=1 Tax=Chryseobacterium limigenitum TaxID=1612149 RepID=A0A1K2IHV4_9FLAO|nr:hypothetical protein [Chryseobacterium limigenitum]SFZ91243.1 hypothetical protein SAMN05216324_102224 [Chryseobacterium limigenitum]